MPFDLAEATAVLSRTPLVLEAWLRDLPEPWIRADEGPGTWSAFDVLGHLIHGERTDWIPRARIILARGDDRAFAPFDRFAQEHESRGCTLDDLLDEFARLRLANVGTLTELPLTAETLDWTGEHPEFGTVTLRQLLATWVAHDLGHLGQIARVQARRYTADVGPWRRYLRVIGEGAD